MKPIFALLALGISILSFANTDSRFSESPSYIQASNMIRFQYLSHEGKECKTGVKTNLDSRVPFYVYAPASSASQVAPGKHAAVLFLHGLGEQGGSVLNMCWPRDNAYYTSIATGLTKVETQAGGPGAAIVAGKFTPQEPMLVIIPQSMSKGGFSADIIRRTLEDASEKMALKGIELDADRVYITGLSMGGGSLVKYVESNPSHFAAAVPIEAANGMNPCVIQTGQVAFWGFAGGAAGNMYSSNLLDSINGSNSCPQSTIEYQNPAYTCKYNGKSCTLLSAIRPESFRATFMPTDGHGGWTQVYNGTHSALPTTNPSIYNWMLSQRNSLQGKPGFPIAYANTTGNSSSSQRSSSSSSMSSLVSSSSSRVSSIASSSSTSLSSASASSTSVAAQSSSTSGNTSPSPILLSPSMILPGAIGNAGALVDEQTSPTPTTYWFAGWQTVYPVEAIIDLGREYTLKEVSLYDANGTGLVEISDGDATHSQLPWISDNLVNYLAFNTYSINQKTRYVRVKKYNTANMSEIRLKGYSVF